MMSFARTGIARTGSDLVTSPAEVTVTCRFSNGVKLDLLCLLLELEQPSPRNRERLDLHRNASRDFSNNVLAAGSCRPNDAGSRLCVF